MNKMKVEIWSDIMCPFCYIGKRRFEAGLAQFEHKEAVEIEWKSFQLNPAMKTEPNKHINEYLAEHKGWTLDYAKQVNGQVTDMAAEVGLHYDFDKAIVANSFNAHRFIQLAKTHKLGDAAEERLFKAYFTEGKNMDDVQTLVELGVEIGLRADEIKEVLNSKAFADNVMHDIEEAQQLGVRGVPFFVINHKYGVSGAQQSETFLGALNKAWEEQDVKSMIEGETCTPDGDCQ